MGFTYSIVIIKKTILHYVNSPIAKMGVEHTSGNYDMLIDHILFITLIRQTTIPTTSARSTFSPFALASLDAASSSISAKFAKSEISIPKRSADIVWVGSRSFWKFEACELGLRLGSGCCCAKNSQ